MKLNRLRIEQLRQFRQPLEISGLAAGVNLIVGPNESGKSTVVRAIRAAFLERYKSSSVEDLLPWGDSAASPTVSLEFEWRGESWKLTKTFLRRQRCDLEVAGRPFSGEAAEEKLADLLGYQFPGRGASKAEHWGIPGLLWIEQGAGQDIEPSVRYAGGYLKSVLDESLGEVASSAGDALMAQVEQEWLKLFTARKRTPTGDRAAALKALGECQRQLEGLDAEIAAYRQQVDRLAELRTQQREDAERRWESYRQQAAQAQARLAEVQDWIRVQEQDAKALEHAQAGQQVCLEQLGLFGRLRDALIQRERVRDQAADALRIQEARKPLIQSGLERARLAYQTAERACQQAYRREKRAALQREQQRLMHEQEYLQQRLDRSNGLLEQLKTYRAELQPLRVDAAALKRIRTLAQDCEVLGIAQESAATRLRFDLQPGRSVHLGRDMLEGRGERLLVEPAALDLPGLGHLDILPGGPDLADLGRRREAAESALRGLLDELRVADAGQAEVFAERRTALEQDIRQAEALLATLAPEGFDSLAAGLAQATDRLAALRAEMDPLALPLEDDGMAVGAAERARDGAREALRQAEQAASGHERDLGLARQAASSAREEWHRLRTSVESPEHQQRSKALNLRLVELRAQEAALRDGMDKRQREIRSAQPDILAQDIQRFNATADALASAAAQRSMELASLQSRLEVLGASGLEERRADTFQRFQYLERRCNELERRAAALDLLLQLLRTQRDALTRRIQAPLQRRLEHYLQLLFAHARLSVDEHLIPDTLARSDPGGESHAGYAALSFGAREQLGLISRLAYADLLRDAGRPTLIILDDALVHSDAQRLAQMKRILFDAAGRHQVLLFSCHPDRWLDLGVVPMEMEILKHPARSTL